MDAHNCYPYWDWWYDRIDRALSAGTPLAIEQDLDWYTDAKTGQSWSVVAHGAPVSGHEPTMEHYFFDRVRPVVERALKEGNHGNWPLITLNLDLKTEEPEHLRAILALLTKYQDWLTTAPKGGGPATPQPLTVRPILVLTGESDAQQAVFYHDVPVGGGCWSLARYTRIRKTRWRRPKFWSRRQLRIIGGGGTIRGAWWNRGASSTRATGRRRMTIGCGRWWSMRTRIICGSASTRWTERRTKRKAATDGSGATISARCLRRKSAGAAPRRKAGVDYV